MSYTIVNIITTLINGGAESSLYRLVVGDSVNRHVVIVLRDEAMYGPLLRKRNIEVIALDIKGGVPGPRVMARLANTLRRLSPDVIQTWMYHGNLLGGVVGKIALNCPIVWCIHNGLLSREATSRSSRLTSMLCAPISGIVPNKIVTCSEHGKSVHIEHGYKAARFAVINNGYDESVFYPDDTKTIEGRRKFNIESGTIVFGMVARWSPEKDHTNLFDALAKLAQDSSQSWKCLLAGHAMNSGNLLLMQELVSRNLQQHVVLCDELDDVPEFMNVLDFHVLSSFSESFPNVIGEAMCSGRPCIATNVGDSSILIGETGAIVDVRDFSQLAGSIHEFILNVGTVSWSERCSAARYRITEHFGHRKMLDSYKNLWACLKNGGV